MAEVTKQDVIDFIANMSVLELSELVKELEDKFGVSAAAPVAMAAGRSMPIRTISRCASATSCVVSPRRVTGVPQGMTQPR